MTETKGMHSGTARSQEHLLLRRQPAPDPRADPAAAEEPVVFHVRSHDHRQLERAGRPTLAGAVGRRDRQDLHRRREPDGGVVASLCQRDQTGRRSRRAGPVRSGGSDSEEPATLGGSVSMRFACEGEPREKKE